MSTPLWDYFSCVRLYRPQSFFSLIIVQLSFSKKYINYFILSLWTDTHTNGHQTPTCGSERSGFRVPYRHNLHVVGFSLLFVNNQRVELLVQAACGVSFLNTIKRNYWQKWPYSMYIFIYIFCMWVRLGRRLQPCASPSLHAKWRLLESGTKKTQYATASP